MNDKTDLGGLLDASPVRRGHVLTVATLFLVPVSYTHLTLPTKA